LEHLTKNSQTSGVLTVVATSKDKPDVALTESEKKQREDCEEILERGLATFFQVGLALLTIQNGRLYRETHSSFEQYCHEKWNIGRSYAFRVIGAAERMKLLPEDVNLPRPLNEFQMRPFLRLAPDRFPQAWKQAVKTGDGKVTSSVARAVIRDLLPSEQQQFRSRRKGVRSKMKTKLPVGQLLTLFWEVKKQVEIGDKEKTLSALERIETLLMSAP